MLLVFPPMQVDSSVTVRVSSGLGSRCLEHFVAMSAGGGLLDMLGGAASPLVASDTYGMFERW
jgi:hypothetical protein